MEKETNYLVLEVHNAYAVVLDNSGRFIKAANCGYEVGDTVDSIIPMIYPQDKRSVQIILSAWLQVWRPVYACVYLEFMNTSLCIRNMEVSICRSILR